MRNRKKFLHHSVGIGLSMLVLWELTVAAWPQTKPDFSGL